MFANSNNGIFCFFSVLRQFKIVKRTPPLLTQGEKLTSFKKQNYLCCIDDKHIKMDLFHLSTKKKKKKKKKKFYFLNVRIKIILQ
jgi:hypothetical protein